MKKLVFTQNRRPTLGIELELALVDADTMALSSSIGPILERVPEAFSDSIKPELMQCYLEINTGVCFTVSEAERDLREKITLVERITDELGLRLLGSSLPSLDACSASTCLTCDAHVSRLFACPA